MRIKIFGENQGRVNLSKVNVGAAANRTEPNRGKPRAKEFIERIFECTNRTTSHGLPHLMLAKKLYQKLIWLSLIIVSFALCSVMVTYNINSYLEFEVVSQFIIKPESEMIFPSVSVCNLDRFASSRGNDYMRNYYRQVYNLSDDDELSSYEQLAVLIRDGRVQEDTEWMFYRTFLDDFEINSNFTKRDLGFSIEDMLFTCEFNRLACNSSDFEWYYHSQYGNCYKFNSNNDSLRSVRSQGHGLYVTMLAALPDIYYNHFNSIPYQGISILIEQPETFPIQREGLVIQLGSHSNININRVDSKRLPWPYGSCIQTHSIHTPLAVEMSRLGMAYSRRNCLVLCQQKQHIDELGCADARLPLASFNAPPCRNKSSFDRLMMKSQSNKHNLSDCGCPLECESVSFVVSTISYTQFPSFNFYTNMMVNNESFVERFYETRHKNNISFEMIKKSAVSFFVYFDDMMSMGWRESEDITLVDMMSNVGGTLGLFGGVSLLTFGELFVLVIDFLLLIIQRLFIHHTNNITLDSKTISSTA